MKSNKNIRSKIERALGNAADSARKAHTKVSRIFANGDWPGILGAAATYVASIAAVSMIPVPNNAESVLQIGLVNSIKIILPFLTTTLLTRRISPGKHSANQKAYVREVIKLQEGYHGRVSGLVDLATRKGRKLTKAELMRIEVDFDKLDAGFRFELIDIALRANADDVNLAPLIDETRKQLTGVISASRATTALLLESKRKA